MPWHISSCKQWEYNIALWVWWQTCLFYTKHCAMCTGVWQSKVAAKTKHCPVSWMIYMVQWLLGPPATSQSEHLLCAWDWTANLIPLHRAWGAGVLPPCQQSSCEQHRLPSSLLPEQRSHTMNVEGQTNNSNLKTHHVSTKNFLQFRLTAATHLQLSWCPETRTLVLLHSISYHWKHNLISVILTVKQSNNIRNEPVLLFRLINCLKPPETVNFERELGNKDKALWCAFSKFLCLKFHLTSWQQMLWNVPCPYKFTVRFSSIKSLLLCHILWLRGAHTQADRAEENKVYSRPKPTLNNITFCSWHGFCVPRLPLLDKDLWIVVTVQ